MPALNFELNIIREAWSTMPAKYCHFAGILLPFCDITVLFFPFFHFINCYESHLKRYYIEGLAIVSGIVFSSYYEQSLRSAIVERKERASEHENCLREERWKRDAHGVMCAGSLRATLIRGRRFLPLLECFFGRLSLNEERHCSQSMPATLQGLFQTSRALHEPKLVQTIQNNNFVHLH